jgi:transmembrane sensor
MRNREDERERIEREASDWVVRIGERTLSPEQEREFAQWRDADPEHERRFRALQRTWGEIPALAGLAALAPLPQAAPAMPAVRRRRWLAGGAATAAAAAIAVVALIPAGRQGAEQHYATALATSRRIALPDGSIVTLGARSAISVRFSANERRIVLDGGEAFFDVVHDAGRPFLVQAGRALVRDIGTRFDVKLGVRTVHVAVQEGQVQVGGARADDSDAAMLRAGQRAEVAQAASSGGRAVTEIVASPLQAAGAWRDGRLVYDNSRLADLVADVNRYYAPGVRLTAGNLGELRITASFRTNEIPAFMDALDGTLPVAVRTGPNGGFEISASRS